MMPLVPLCFVVSLQHASLEHNFFWYHLRSLLSNSSTFTIKGENERTLHLEEMSMGKVAKCGIEQRQ